MDNTPAQNNFNQPAPPNQNIESIQPPTPNTPRPIQSVSEKKKNPLWIKILASIGGFIIFVLILVLVIFFIVSANSKKLECTSSQGDITILYDDDKLTGYSALNITYDFDEQQKYAEKIGVNSYLDEFTSWFKSTTDGICTRR